MAAVTLTAVQQRQSPNDGYKYNPEYQVVINDIHVVAISEFIDNNTKNVDDRFAVVNTIAGGSIICKHTFAELQTLFPMT